MKNGLPEYLAGKLTDKDGFNVYEMYIFYNGDIIDGTQFRIAYQNRAFLYGDGVFETIIFAEGKLRLEHLHRDRLATAMEALHFRFSDEMTIDTVFSKITSLAIQSKFESARIRLHISRQAGGLYEPDKSLVDVLATCEAFPLVQPYAYAKGQVSFSNNVRLSPSPWSRFKTISGIAYVQAAIEKKQRGFDDLILEDYKGNISECTSSNIFWKIKDTYYTPSLRTGCIDGVMRKHIISTMRAKHVQVEIGEYAPEVLHQATEVFTSNVAGISPILSIDNYQYSDEVGIILLLGL